MDSRPQTIVLKNVLFFPVMGPVRIRHCSRHFATQSSHFVDRAGWQAKMASIELWIPRRYAHSPHSHQTMVLFSNSQHQQASLLKSLFSVCFLLHHGPVLFTPRSSVVYTTVRCCLKALWCYRALFASCCASLSSCAVLSPVALAGGWR